MPRRLALSLALVPAGASPSTPRAPALPSAAGSRTLSPPIARIEPWKTELHGETLVDDYAWLRNKGRPDVEAYLEAELAYARAYMKPTEALQAKLYEQMVSR